MLTEDRTTHPSRHRQDPSGGQWWATTGLTGLMSSSVAAFVAMVLTWDLEDGSALFYAVAVAPLVLAGLVTGVVGGVRRWWLIVPSAAAPLAWLGAVWGEGVVYPHIEGSAYWSLVIGMTAVATVVGAWLIRRFTH